LANMKSTMHLPNACLKYRSCYETDDSYKPATAYSSGRSASSPRTGPPAHWSSRTGLSPHWSPRTGPRAPLLAHWSSALRPPPRSSCTAPRALEFSVRSLGWMQVLDEDLGPGRSSLTVSHVIQQLSHQPQAQSRTRVRTRPRPTVRTRRQDSAEPLQACGEFSSLSLVLFFSPGPGHEAGFEEGFSDPMDPLDHTPLTVSQSSNIRVCGRRLQQRQDQYHVRESCRPTRSLTMESISPEDFPRQVQCVEAVQQQVQKFPVRYIGNLPVSTAMELMTTSDPDDWDSAHIHVTHSALSLWRGEDLLWELPVRFLTFLGVGQDSHTFAVIVDRGTQRFQCHVFYCDPHAGDVSEAVQAACMAQYQRCLVAQTPRPRPKVKRAASVDATATALHHFHGNGSGSALSSSVSNISGGSVSGVRRVMAFFDTLRNKPTATSS
ncbi:hypothetical protein WMY93_033897, partial [Mugilogobius chulae]